jgi:hypothetical protein
VPLLGASGDERRDTSRHRAATAADYDDTRLHGTSSQRPWLRSSPKTARAAMSSSPHSASSATLCPTRPRSEPGGPWSSTTVLACIFARLPESAPYGSSHSETVRRVAGPNRQPRPSERRNLKPERMPRRRHAFAVSVSAKATTRLHRRSTRQPPSIDSA